jgi:DNA helicase HerA-like ATPase
MQLVERSILSGLAPTAELGSVIATRGSQASVSIARQPALGADARVTVGKFLGILAGRSLLIGVVTNVALSADARAGDRDLATVAVLDIIGEIQDHGAPSASFHRGVSHYPAIGDKVGFIGPGELQRIFNITGPAVIEIGHLQQDQAIGAYVDADDMLAKHFAVLGTTGVGKSSGVALILQKVMAARPDLRVLVLDVHNEYRACFGAKALALSPRNLKLPFWLFNFEEIVDVFFGARPGLDEEIDLLAEAIPAAKAAYADSAEAYGRISIKRNDAVGLRYTVDVPVPYRIADLVSLLNTRMGKLENRASRMMYQKLITRIETVSNDPRYAFMFEKANVGGDTMAEIVGMIFRRPANGVPMTVLQLAGFPSDVVDAIVSVISRMAFDLGVWSDGGSPLLLVCEEAHRYMSADHSVGFGPTRRALSRIAKEGRKYGVYLGLVSQRPAELDPTILAQCNTLFAMRMTNDRDQELLRSAVSDTAADLLSFLPSLGTGEVFAFGEGVALPTRFRFRQLSAAELPRSEAPNRDSESEAVVGENPASLAAVVERWRGVVRDQRPVQERSADNLSSLAGSVFSSALLRTGSGLSKLSQSE